MPATTYDTKDAIPETQRDAAIETKDGKFIVVEDEDATDLKEALKAQRDRADAAEKLTKKIAKELKDMETKAKAADAGISDEQLQKMRADLEAEIRAEYEPKLRDAEAIAAENRTLTFDHAGLKLIAEAGFLPDRVADLWELHKRDFEPTADKKLMVKGKPGVDPAKHIEALKAKRPEWVQGSQASGGGAAGTSGGAPIVPPVVDVLKNPGAALQAARAAGATE